MSDLSVKAAGFKGYTPNFRAAKQDTAEAVKIEPSKDSFIKEKKEKSKTSKALVAAGAIALVVLGLLFDIL